MRKTTAVLMLLPCLGGGVAGADTLPFYDSFELGILDPAWWVPMPGPDGGWIDVWSNCATDGLYCVRMGRNSDGPYTVNALDLHLDLSGEDQVELDYSIRSFYDDSHQEDVIQFSDDGGATFVDVLPLNPGSWRQNAWLRFPPLDVDKEASLRGLSLTDQFVIRFQQAGYGDFNTSSIEDGFYLDEVRVSAFEPVYATLPFEDGFEDGEFGPSWAWTWPDETANTAHIRPETRVQVTTGYAVRADSGGSFGTLLGRYSDGGRVTGALDLHLDLAGNGQVELSFWLRDYYDETDVDDGIWFSDDGGETFEKVYQFEPTLYLDNTWQEFVLDLGALAADAGLTLTDRSVVRFQQSGTGDFNTTGDEDGFAIDDVLVTGDDCDPPMCGDADCNGSVNIVDALAVARHVAGLPPPPLVDLAAADIDDPSNGVNIVDALMIARSVAGLSVSGTCLVP